MTEQRNRAREDLLDLIRILQQRGLTGSRFMAGVDTVCGALQAMLTIDVKADRQDSGGTTDGEA